ncbi:hypothetical protein BRADI_3g50085v3 [Brachypodium distachyon]|uniref:Uncharacterized protein n=1 Tax=Brachypodium distachyon TaxID=15368 RepID=A0A2K2D4D6_BRADI|nr:hypothetical protein BRADI_3g50085v3 [Brachypodium distachyon]
MGVAGHQARSYRLCDYDSCANRSPCSMATTIC